MQKSNVEFTFPIVNGMPDTSRFRITILSSTFEIPSKEGNVSIGWDQIINEIINRFGDRGILMAAIFCIGMREKGFSIKILTLPTKIEIDNKINKLMCMI